MGDHRLSEQVKKLWHEACFKKVGVPAPTPENKSRIKYHWERKESFVSLKQFVRQLVADGNPLAAEWKSHKEGSLNQKRTETNQMVARASGQASRLARKSKKSSGGAKEAKTDKPKTARGV